MTKYNFTEDYFSQCIPSFSSILSKFKGVPAKFLEVGSFEGRSACWMLENILTHPDSRLICVDKHVYNTEDVLTGNVSRFGNSVEIISHDSLFGLSTLICRGEKLDFIFIDGNHDSYYPLRDLVFSFNLLQNGGFICIDDCYDAINTKHGNFTVRSALLSFMQAYEKHIRILQLDTVAWVEKIND